MRKEALEEKHTDTLTSKHWIAMCIYEKLQFHEAELKFREVEKCEKKY